MNIQTSEISKETSYSIAACLDMIDDCVIRDDHSLQRQSEQWSNKTKGDLIVTVLHNYPIPAIIIAEQVINGITIQWLIDGKQRCSNLYLYRHNKFKISKNAERPVIAYQSALRDAQGRIVKDESGNPRYEIREMNVQGKYYRDLPEELQKIYDKYTIPVVLYLSCSDDDIEYHIRRYNAAKPMSVAQKGITHLGDEYARAVKAIAGMSFFRNQGNYRISEFTNGTVDRVITESIMVINFLPDWKKRNEDICSYLKKNVKLSHFNRFEKLVDRLAEVINGVSSDMFNSRDSFLWFGLFDRFTESGLEDESFVEFMEAFRSRLRRVPVEGVTFESLNVKSTKDKSIVIRKLNMMELLMDEYLHIKKEEIRECFHIKTKEMQDYTAQFAASRFMSSLDIRSKNDSIRIAVQTLMLAAGERDYADSSVQKFIDERSFTDRQNDINDNDILRNGIQQNGIQQNGIQQNGIQQNGIQQNDIQQNNIKKNDIQQNGIQQNSIQQNNIRQNDMQLDKMQTEDIMLYLDILNDWSVKADLGSPLFETKNIPALVNVVAYSCNKEIDDIAGDWFEAKAEEAYTAGREDSAAIEGESAKTGLYESYRRMISSLDRYVEYIRKRRTEG